MSELCYWVALSMVPRIGPVRVRALLDHFGDLALAWRADAAALRAAGLPQDAIERLLATRQRLDPAAELEKARAVGLRVLCWESADYPALLSAIPQPPPVLYLRGDLAPADEWAIAVVGTRQPTTYGKEVARQMARGLAQNGVTVVSGLALGIDGVAHRAALEAGGRTLAVLAHGLDMLYPPEHRDLAARITQAGALISDYPLGTRPEANNFPPRNRIISGLARGTLVVEAGEGSGALITLRFALEQGRETFAVPGNITSPRSAGTNLALQMGEAKLVTKVQDILEELNLAMAVQQGEMRQALPDTPQEERLLDLLSREPLHIDELVRSTGLPTPEVTSALGMMELKGLVRQVGGMNYVLA